MRPRRPVGAHTQNPIKKQQPKLEGGPPPQTRHYSSPEENQPPKLTNRPGSRQTPGPDGRKSSIDNLNGQTSRPGDITPHYAGSETAVTHHRKKKIGPQGRQPIKTFPFTPQQIFF